ncbi:MAG: hypothetical protein KC731_06175 [Myxococcales bacterium]|nr:hypothetical protein [Myxococcales bacterium]
MPVQMTLPLVRRDALEAGYHVLHFQAESPLAAEPGHFAMLRGAAWGKAPLLPRPMSLLTGGARPSVLIKVVGEGTRLMAEASPGSLFSILAPLGRPWRLPEPNEIPVLVAGGVGVAPLIHLAERLAALGHRPAGDRPAVRALYGGRRDADLPLSDQLEAVGRLEVTTEDGSRGTQGRVTVLLERLLAEHAGTPLRVYCCGPHGMMAAVAALAAAAGVACEASLEAPMGCGYGVCLGCAVARPGGGYLYTCVDGPCVSAADVDWSARVF